MKKLKKLKKIFINRLRKKNKHKKSNSISTKQKKT